MPGHTQVISNKIEQKHSSKFRQRQVQVSVTGCTKLMLNFWAFFRKFKKFREKKICKMFALFQSDCDRRHKLQCIGASGSEQYQANDCWPPTMREHRLQQSRIMRLLKTVHSAMKTMLKTTEDYQRWLSKNVPVKRQQATIWSIMNDLSFNLPKLIAHRYRFSVVSGNLWSWSGGNCRLKPKIEADSMNGRRLL